MEPQIIRIRNINMPNLLPIKIYVGDYYEICIRCDSYQIENETLYAYVGYDIVFSMSFLDIEDIIFERCV